MRNVVDLYEPVQEEAPQVLRTRREEAALFKTGALFDVVIIGGAPVALYLARLLALHELRCAIIVEGEFPSTTGECVELLSANGSLRRRWAELDIVMALTKSAQGAVAVSRQCEQRPWRETVARTFLELLRRFRGRSTIPGDGSIACTWSRSRVSRELLVAARQEGCAVLLGAGTVRTVPTGDEFLVAVENDGLQRIRAGAVVNARDSAANAGWVLGSDRVYRVAAASLVDGIRVAEELSQTVLSYLPRDSLFAPSRYRPWPGCAGDARSTVTRLCSYGVPEQLAERAVARFGSRAGRMESMPGGLSIDDSGQFLMGERMLVIAEELADSEEEIRRRLDVDLGESDTRA
jgi:hypothetical protein